MSIDKRQWRSHTSGVRYVRTLCQENTYMFGMRFLSNVRVKPSERALILVVVQTNPAPAQCAHHYYFIFLTY